MTKPRRWALLTGAALAVSALLAGCSGGRFRHHRHEVRRDRLRAAGELHAELDPADRHRRAPQHQQRLHRAVAVRAPHRLRRVHRQDRLGQARVRRHRRRLRLGQQERHDHARRPALV
ncbi:hypothetical protein [Curtobacterium sp. MCPF17_052]|uniref:hypothetical protein n=1 Tax=Curtobacterium sp. MCPF17_052 TaxID=2175655 RepID=UPI0024DFE9DB|nr:hypothetical protein [Curtobacterium sp. MCPF17_052]WIB11520.1 hypothetical protein DEJ36_11085 [Curtobacterium sp. MCPF17_052]